MRRLRILLAEANLGTRQEVVELLRSDVDIAIVGIADDGRKAVAMTERLHPDMVLMGARLRTMDGLDATREIMIECPTPILVLSSDHSPRTVDLAVRALRSGALSVLDVPTADAETFPRGRSEFLSTIRALSEVKLVRRWRGREPKPAPEAAGLPRSGSAVATKIVAIASSTGGPAVLETILLGLPHDFPAPVVIVQHIADGFLGGVAAWLNQTTSFKVKVAAPRELLVPGIAYLAPDNWHMGVSRARRVHLSDAPPINGFRPSADFLFDSVARSFGRNGIGVIVTGMGRDGVDGLRSMRRVGGRIIAQDEHSSVVFGMPRAAIQEGLVHEVLPAREISAALRRAVVSNQEQT